MTRMRSKAFVLCALAAAFTPRLAAAQDVAITNARVIVGNGTVIESGTIVVRGGKIVFSSLYIMSACCLTANRNPQLQSMAAAAAIKTREQAEEAARAPGFGPSVSLASAAAWSPNPNNPPLYIDLPVKDGKVRPDVVAKWVANAPLEMLAQFVPGLTAQYQITIDIGNKDTLLASNRQLHDALLRLRIPHVYEEYDGDHTSGVRERIERGVLPFFSKNLAAPANPSSPVPQR